MLVSQLKAQLDRYTNGMGKWRKFFHRVLPGHLGLQRDMRKIYNLHDRVRRRLGDADGDLRPLETLELNLIIESNKTKARHLSQTIIGDIDAVLRPEHEDSDDARLQGFDAVAPDALELQPLLDDSADADEEGPLDGLSIHQRAMRERYAQQAELDRIAVNEAAAKALQEEEAFRAAQAFQAEEAFRAAQAFQAEEALLHAIMAQQQDEFRPDQPQGDEPQQAFSPFQDKESTHTASVNKSILASAALLMQRYGQKDNLHTDDGCMLQLQLMQIEINQRAGNLKADAAARFIAQLLLQYTNQRLRQEHEFTCRLDQEEHNVYVNSLSIKQVAALCWLGIQDEEYRVEGCTISKDAIIDELIDGLYQCQRWNNQKDGLDNGAEDASMCKGGQFNKLVEKMASILPAVQIRVVTMAQASLKLPIIVTEEAMRYLVSIEDRQEQRRIAEQIYFTDGSKEDMLSSVWQEIRPVVSARFKEEFGEVFVGKQANLLEPTIDTGKSIDPVDHPIYVQTMAQIIPDMALPYMIAEQTIDHLKQQRSQAHSQAAKRNFKTLLQRVKVEGVSAIWSVIKEAVIRKFKAKFTDRDLSNLDIDEYAAMKHNNLAQHSNYAAELERLERPLAPAAVGGGVANQPAPHAVSLQPAEEVLQPRG